MRSPAQPSITLYCVPRIASEFVRAHGNPALHRPFGPFHRRRVLWSWGCFACCALVITAPVGALLCRAWAGRQGDDVARRTWVGAACWAAGFLPWVYLACEINGRTVPRKTIKAAYAALFIAWLWGPIIGGFSSASVSSSDVATLFPVVSLLVWLVSLVWVGYVGIMPETPSASDSSTWFPASWALWRCWLSCPTV